ncbi:hypothetical protein GB937_000690 [Aspergillus fischeri]|nr:hypothetical protein GB937_000690 [Aspergillus fischeri]
MRRLFVSIDHDSGVRRMSLSARESPEDSQKYRREEGIIMRTEWDERPPSFIFYLCPHRA